MDLDDMYNAVGWTKYQVLMVVFTRFCRFGVSMAYSLGPYLSAVPEHRCVTPVDEVENITAGNLSLTIGSCERYNYNFTNCNSTECLLEQGDVGSIPCDNGWVYSNKYYQETTVTQWDLVCGRRTLDSAANSIFFAGIFLGSAISGPASNRFGRKKTMVVSIWCLGVFTIIEALVPWFEFYVFCRTMTSAAAISSTLSGYTLVLEINPMKRRNVSTMIGALLSTIFAAFVPLFAWIFRDWTKYTLLIGCLAFPFSILALFIPESPRWLMLNGKETEAKKVMQRIHQSAGKELNEKQWEDVVKTEKDHLAKSKEANNTQLSYLDLFRYPMTRLVILNSMFTWFAVTLIYYGLLLNITSFAGDPYVNGTLNTLVSVFSTVAALTADYFGRRRLLVCSFLATSAFCITSMLLKINADGRSAFETGAVATAIIGNLFASLVFGMAYLITGEAFPTSLRSLALGISSMSGRVGSIITPFILQLQYEFPWLTQTLFSILAFLAGLAALTYPETKSVELVTTIEEGESRFIEMMPKTAAFFKINRRKMSNDNKATVFVNDEAEQNGDANTKI